MSKGLKKIYSEISTRYEFANHVLTWGLDVLWRERAAKVASEGGGQLWLDLCSGTGEMAANLRRFGKDASIISADFSPAMLSEAAAKNGSERFAFALADAKALPFRDGTFDLVTVSFATRNINVNSAILVHCFREIRRVLGPGGRFVNVETSQPPSKVIRTIFHFYTGNAIPPLGRILGGSGPGYEILSQTMLRFHDADALAALMREAGFKKVTYRKMMFGVAAIHNAT